LQTWKEADAEEWVVHERHQSAEGAVVWLAGFLMLLQMLRAMFLGLVLWVVVAVWDALVVLLDLR
jgi:hypothetical protein